MGVLCNFVSFLKMKNIIIFKCKLIVRCFGGGRKVIQFLLIQVGDKINYCKYFIIVIYEFDDMIVY